MKNITLYAFTIVSLLFASCSNDDAADTEKPVIVLVEPIVPEGFKPGSEIHVEGILTDNDGLASYKIEIHGAEDGHTHNHARTATNYFHYEQTITLAEFPKVHEMKHEILIPTIQNNEALSTGHYHLGIFALDKSGNQEQVFIEIYIGEDADTHQDAH